MEPYQVPVSIDQEPKQEEPKKDKGNRRHVFVALAIAFAMVLSTAGITVGMMRVSSSGDSGVSNSASDGSTPSLSINGTPETEISIPDDIEELATVQIAAKVTPSVVGIVSHYRSSSSEGQGSGIVMSQDGFIITNAHVVSGADGINVVLHDKEEYAAKLVGIDEKTDLAVLKISAEGLTPAAFGDSSKLVVGEEVVAIGNPGGLEFSGSVTRGIVSALNRSINLSDGTGVTLNCIQTDAAISPGNSGGALVNRYGQVIGINTAKISSEGYEGLGFAIFINDAKPIIDDLLDHGYVRDRVKIGIRLSVVDEVLAEMYSTPVGMKVESIESTSNAYGQLQVGDVITHMDGQEIRSTEDISNILIEKKPGDTIDVTLYRPSEYSGETLSFTIELQEDVSAG